MYHNHLAKEWLRQLNSIAGVSATTQGFTDHRQAGSSLMG